MKEAERHHSVKFTDSSNLHWARYDRQTQQLEIDFKDSKGNYSSTYSYTNVPQDLYDGLLASSSKGQYFAHHIRNAKHADGRPKYPATRMPERKSESA